MRYFNVTLRDRIASHDEGDTPVVKFLSREDNEKEPLNIFVNSYIKHKNKGFLCF